MNEKSHILVVDDEPSIRLTLETGLSLKGFRVSTASSGREALSFLRQQKFDAILCDILMPDGDGLELARSIREIDKDLPLVLMTAQGSVETAVKAIGEGANDFIAKPFEVSAVAILMRRYLEARREKQDDSTGYEQTLSDEFSKSGLIGRSPAMVSVYKLVAFAARTDATVLVTGESGTGKELVARAVHSFSDRAAKKFVSVNCAGLTDSLLEAELFGYEKGAFTGAEARRAGLFEAADGGTIFLDELASTSAAFQASLLRVLQSREIRRVGATETRPVDVRIVGASNGDLKKLAETGNFRPDLYYRLSVLTIELPPLKERTGDVPLLTQHFLRRNAQENEQPPHLTRDVWEALSRYSFPGNVRELENAIIQAGALSRSNIITLDCLPAAIAGAKDNDNNFPAESETVRDLIGDRPTIDELQRRYLSLILSEVGGNRRRVAEKLGLDRRTIQRLIAKYNLFASSDDWEPDETRETASENE
jgi:DNA-binding NtrC family response regulator